MPPTVSLHGALQESGPCDTAVLELGTPMRQWAWRRIKNIPPPWSMWMAESANRTKNGPRRSQTDCGGFVFGVILDRSGLDGYNNRAIFPDQSNQV